MTTWNILTDYPSIRRPSSFSRIRIPNRAIMQSPLTGSIQSADRAGARWQVRCEWIIPGDERTELETLLTRLNGTEHRIRLPMYDFYQTRRGSWGGGVTVDGAGQTGSTLNATGGIGNANVTGYARAGDFCRVDTADECVHQVLADADTDAVGDFTLELWPPLRSSPTNGANLFTATNITGLYFLREFAEVATEDILASGEILSRIEAIFEDDVLG